MLLGDYESKSPNNPKTSIEIPIPVIGKMIIGNPKTSIEIPIPVIGKGLLED